jgi:hypothetical protein
MANQANDGRLIEEHVLSSTVDGAAGPYLVVHRVVEQTEECWNAGYDQQAPCKCGHPYHRHFDTWEDMYPIGCKYCDCPRFEPAEKESK